MTTVLVLGLSVLAIGIVAFAGFHFYRRTNNIERQQSMTLKTLYVSVRELRALGYRVDELASENRAAFANQAKSLEHQRILAASLGRQIGNIEAMLSNTKPRFENRPRPLANKTQRSNHRSASQTDMPPQEASHVPVASLLKQAGSGLKGKNEGAVLLEKLFEQSRKASVQEPAPAAPDHPPALRELARVAAALHPAKPEEPPLTREFDERRVSNG